MAKVTKGKTSKKEVKVKVSVKEGKQVPKKQTVKRKLETNTEIKPSNNGINSMMEMTEHVESILQEEIVKIKPIVKQEPPVIERESPNAKDDKITNNDAQNSPSNNKIAVRSIKLPSHSVYHAGTADVNFVFDTDGGKEMIPVHKCILAANSPVFRRMLYDSDLKETGDIELIDTTIEEFVSFIEFLYGAAFWRIVQFSKSEITSLVYLAHKYDVEWLEVELKSVLNLFIDEYELAALWVLPLADLYNYDELRLKCIEKIRRNIDEIINSEEFVNYDQTVVREILSTNIADQNKEKVLENCIEWTKRTCENAKLDPESSKNIQAQLSDCLNLNRKGRMTSRKLEKHLSDASEKIQTNSCNVFETKIQHDAVGCNSKDGANDIYIKKRLDINSSCLEALFQDRSTTDVTIILKNEKNEETKRFLVHKCILMKRSAMFAEMLKNSNESTQEIHITDGSPEIFEMCLQFIYTCSWFSFVQNVSNENLEEFLVLLNKYKIVYFTKYPAFCEQHLGYGLNRQNVMWRFDIAHKYSLDPVKSKCVEYLMKSGEKAIASEKFSEIRLSTLKSVLEARVWGDGKLIVDACIKWAKKRCEKDQLDPTKPKNLRNALDSVFELIPFSAMGLMDFNEFQYDYDSMFKATEIRKIYNMLAKRRREN